MPDEAAARLVGLTTSASFKKRVSLGISPYCKSSEEAKFHWKAPQLRALGKAPDSFVAKELGVSVSVVNAKRHSLGISASRPVGNIRNPWSADELAILGKKPDTVVAAETERGRRHVRAKRESLGIPPFQQQKSIRWTTKIMRKLGTVPDAVLAKELDVAPGTVALHRRRFRIKPVGRIRNKK